MAHLPLTSSDLLLATLWMGAMVVMALAGLRGWSQYLGLKHRELELASQCHRQENPATPITARIELADLRERIRKLEAIAAGVDL